MSETIIVALISGGITLIGTILAFYISNKQIKVSQKKESEEQLSKFKSDITDKLEAHRTEYLHGIDEVHDAITDMQSVYQQTVAVVDLKLDNLEKKQDKHNSLMERTFQLERDTSVMSEQIKVANHRIEDLERKV